MLVLLVAGCAGIDEYYNRLETVSIGDDRSTMIDKMGFKPPSWRCWNQGPDNDQYCTAGYSASGSGGGRQSSFWFRNGQIFEISL